MQSNKLILILVFFVMISIVEAIPPVIQSSSDLAQYNNLIIEYPKMEYFKQNSYIELNFHVFNASANVVNKTKPYKTSCYIHIYNENGEHFIEQELKTHYETKDYTDWFINLTETNTSRIGTYPYIVWCNSSSAMKVDTPNGFLSNNFKINQNGFSPTIEKIAIYAFLILLISAFFIGSLISTFSINGKNKQDEMGNVIGITSRKYLKIFFGAIAYLCIWILSYLSAEMASYLDFIMAYLFFNMIFEFLYLMMIPVLLVLGWIFIALLVKDKRLQKMIDRGDKELRN